MTASGPTDRELPLFLSDRAAADTDHGWGERVIDPDPDDLRRFLDERPPHHGD